MDEYLTFQDLRAIGDKYGWKFKDRTNPRMKGNIPIVDLAFDMPWPPIEGSLEVPASFLENHFQPLNCMFDVIGQALAGFGWKGTA